MLGFLFILIGGTGMVVGVMMLTQWLGATSRPADSTVYDSAGETKNQRQFIDLYFIATVIAPLLIGAMLILMGLRRML